MTWLPRVRHRALSVTKVTRSTCGPQTCLLGRVFQHSQSSSSSLISSTFLPKMIFGIKLSHKIITEFPQSQPEESIDQIFKKTLIFSNFIQDILIYASTYALTRVLLDRVGRWYAISIFEYIRSGRFCSPWEIQRSSFALAGIAAQFGGTL